MTTSKDNIEQFSVPELSIIQELADGKKKFSELQKATGLSPRWLDRSLKKLKKGVVEKASDEAHDSLGWELNPKWRKDNQKIIAMLNLVRMQDSWAKIKGEEERERESLPGESTRIQLWAVFILAYTLTVAMKHYNEEQLVDLIKRRSVNTIKRIMDHAFDSVEKLTKPQRLSFYREAYNIDLDDLSFDAFMNQSASFFADLHKQHDIRKGIRTS